MKLFVTDAQLAQMRYGFADYERARFDAALDRLRADRDAEVARLRDPSAAFVAHLQAEVEFWRLLYTAERQRNDTATDQRLAERGLGGITGPTRPLAPERMPSTLEELIRSTELGAIGDAQGVER
jgi:hypothetical protein